MVECQASMCSVIVLGDQRFSIAVLAHEMRVMCAYNDCRHQQVAEVSVDMHSPSRRPFSVWRSISASDSGLPLLVTLVRSDCSTCSGDHLTQSG
jgi:hypothetical protein